MDLLENPFHILGASPRDDRRRLLELAEEKSLSLEPSVCSQARTELTNPRNRLAIEVAWLPGLDPTQAGEAMAFLRNSPADIRSAQGLPSLAKANLLAAALARADGTWKDGELPTSILELATLLESCNAESVRTLINEERAVAGFPEVRETTAVEEALAERRRHFRTALKTALDALPPFELVGTVTQVVTEATSRGTRSAPGLIEDLVNTYEVETQRFLEAEARNVELLVEAIRGGLAKKCSVEALKPLLARIEGVVSNWDLVAQPIQLSSMSRGLDHDLSHRVALLVRNLALELFNEYGLLEQSQQLTALLRDAFAEVPRVAEVTTEDAQTLRELREKREASRQAWAREIAFEAMVGHPTPQMLTISTVGVDWNGVRWPLDAISRVRWGGVRRHPQGRTEFSISFGNGQSYANVATYNSDIYSAVTEKLWRAVGRRLVFDMICTFQKGGRMKFGDAIVDDQGIDFAQHRYKGDTDRFRAAWGHIHIESQNGALLLRHKQEYSAYAVLPYSSVDNVHILENAIRHLLDTKFPVLMSDLLKN